MQGKVWGKTMCIIQQPGFEVHRIEVDRGGYCSLHGHEHKWNMFHVEHGELQVFIHHTNGLVDETTLKSGDSCQVAPGMLHRFSAVGCTVAYEVYWPAPIDSGDIQREDTGGIRE